SLGPLRLDLGEILEGLFVEFQVGDLQLLGLALLAHGRLSSFGGPRLGLPEGISASGVTPAYPASGEMRRRRRRRRGTSAACPAGDPGSPFSNSGCRKGGPGMG